MIRRPMPPLVPVDTSATIAPTTAVAAPSRSAGSTYGTLAGSRSDRNVRHGLAACARNSSTCACCGDWSPAQGADRDGEEREVRRDQRDRHPPLPHQVAEVDLAAPAHDQRCERNERDRLAEHDPRVD